MLKMKKIASLAMASVMVMGMNMGALANEHGSHQKRLIDALEVKGFSQENIKVLGNLGFDLQEQLSLSEGELQKLLGGTFGQESNPVTPRPATGQVYVTGIPDEILGTDNEMFKSGTGMSDGDFYDDNNGATIVSRVNKFTQHVYGGESNSNINNTYYLYGERLGSNYPNSFHRGTDVQSSGEKDIISANEGDIKKRSDYGAVIIQDGSYSYAYLHMKNLTSKTHATTSTIIGTQSNKSPDSIGSHLHYEVRSGTSTSLGNPTATSNSNVSPYYHMIKEI